jgi:anaerobic magnesium-protoporphyrin IX monomethyl ester cyclase
MLHIGFVLPPDIGNFKPFRSQPLTSLYLLTILEEKFGDKVDLSVIDLRGITRENARYYLPEKDVYFYTLMSQEYRNVCEVKDLLRSIYPKSLHVAGGVHVNLFQEDSARIFDSIALGEGDDTVVTIVEDILSGDLKPVYEKSDPVDINRYPYPDRKYIPLPAVVETRLLGGEYIDLPGTSVLFSRGCPFRCSFCANVNFGPTRFRTPELIEAEIEYLKKQYNVRALALKDDNAIPTNRKIAGPFLEAIARTHVKWRGQSRANGISEDMVKLAAESGCTDLGIGIESVWPEALKLINKKIKLEEAKQYIRALRKYGIGARLHLIFGLPGEPEDIVPRTLEFIEESEPSSVLLNLFCPLPGSDIALNPRAYGIKNVSLDWHDYRNLYARFDEEEQPHMWFEYNETTPWGKSMSNERIIANYSELQAVLRERNLNF